MATKKAKPQEDAAVGGNDIAGFESALKLIGSVCGPVPHVSITAGRRNTVTVAGSFAGSEASCRVLSAVEGMEPGATVTVGVADITAAIRGRKTGRLRLKDNGLSVSSGNYSANIVVGDPNHSVNITPPEGEGVTSLHVTPELYEWLSKSVAEVGVEKIHSTLGDAMLMVEVTETSRTVAAFDRLQMCFSRRKQTDELRLSPMRLELSYNEANALLRGVPMANSELFITSEEMIVIAANFRVRKVLPIVADALDANSVLETMRALVSADADQTVSVDIGQLRSFLDNSREVASTGSSVRFHMVGDHLEVTIEGERGSTKMRVPGGSVSREFAVDFSLLNTAVAKKNGGKKGEPSGTMEFDTVNGNSVLRMRGALNYTALLQAELVEGEDDDD